MPVFDPTIYPKAADIVYDCSSGNHVEVRFPKDVRLLKTAETSVAWNSYPPSDADMQEFERHVTPMIAQAAAGLAKQVRGAHLN